jgi:hypothetical protein
MFIARIIDIFNIQTHGNHYGLRAKTKFVSGKWKGLLSRKLQLFILDGIIWHWSLYSR